MLRVPSTRVRGEPSAAERADHALCLQDAIHSSHVRRLCRVVGSDSGAVAQVAGSVAPAAVTPVVHPWSSWHTGCTVTVSTGECETLLPLHAALFAMPIA